MGRYFIFVILLCQSSFDVGAGVVQTLALRPSDQLGLCGPGQTLVGSGIPFLVHYITCLDLLVPFIRGWPSLRHLSRNSYFLMRHTWTLRI